VVHVDGGGLLHDGLRHRDLNPPYLWCGIPPRPARKNGAWRRTGQFCAQTRLGGPQGRKRPSSRTPGGTPEPWRASRRR
jgi:hypothetical protein